MSPYVEAGYGVVTAALVGYGAVVSVRARKLRAEPLVVRVDDSRPLEEGPRD
ncbi:MAG: hypothetical protein ACP5O0_02010 [Acidimicrobiales bacterium]